MDWERESLSVSHARSSEFSPLGVSAWHIAIVIAVAPAPAAAVRAQMPSRQLDAERLRAGGRLQLWTMYRYAIGWNGTTAASPPVCLPPPPIMRETRSVPRRTLRQRPPPPPPGRR